MSYYIAISTLYCHPNFVSHNVKNLLLTIYNNYYGTMYIAFSEEDS